MKVRPTLRDVAAIVGLSISCTARALKGRPGFPPATYDRVQKAARAVGYSRDPLLTALSSYRQARKPSRFRETIAFLSTIGSEKTFLSDEGRDLLLGARARGRELGYRVAYFEIGTTLEANVKTAKILRAQGVKAFLIRSFPFPIESLAFPFSQFIGINLFSDPYATKLSAVSSYHAQSMQWVMDELVKRNYRRPMLMIGSCLSQSLQHGWRMTFLANAKRFSKMSSYDTDKRAPLAEHARYIKEKKADVLIYCTSENRIPPAFLQPGTKLGVVCMDLLDPKCGVSGIDQNRFRAGQNAVEWLQGILITQKEHAVQEMNAMLIPGVWIDGATL
jgi:DNA-binding LacI/PurR family transcriptional regulator